MAENRIVKEILSTYDEIKILYEEDDIVFFSCMDKEYGIWCPVEAKRTDKPFIFVKNDNQYDYPHIMQFEFPINKDKQKVR